jgi:alcohol dehydrogenase class IV
MDLKFDFSTSSRIIFGSGESKNIGRYISTFGKKAFIVKGGSSNYGYGFFKLIDSCCEKTTYFSVKNEPNTELINSAVQLARSNHCDFVIGFGGGSVIDTGKAVAALLSNEGDLLDYLEVVGKGLPLRNLAKPYIAIPTTAGTGSEVTRNAVIDVPEKKVKVSMRNAYMLPAIALIDPELTLNLPPEITASTGMDAFVQVVEPYICNSPNVMVDMFCRDAIPRAAKYLPKAFLNGSDLEARQNMSWVSLMGGLSLANGKLGAVHGFAGPMGGMFHAPHGALCAALLPAVFEINYKSIIRNNSSNPLIKRFDEIAMWITGSPKATVYDAISKLIELSHYFKLKTLCELGITKEDFPEIVEKAKNASSMKGNPVALEDAELRDILEKAF